MLDLSQRHHYSRWCAARKKYEHKAIETPQTVEAGKHKGI